MKQTFIKPDPGLGPEERSKPPLVQRWVWDLAGTSGLNVCSSFSLLLLHFCQADLVQMVLEELGSAHGFSLVKASRPNVSCLPPSAQGLEDLIQGRRLPTAFVLDERSVRELQDAA